MIRKNLISIAIAIVILYLSLTGSETFDKIAFLDIPFLDKIVHAAMYFTLMLSLIFENKNIIGSIKSYVILSTIPFIYGVLIELLQAFLTVGRQGDIVDIFFNLGGIILAILFWLFLKRITG